MPKTTPITRTLPWADPLSFAAGIPPAMQHWALLHSSMESSYSGQSTLLALHPQQTLTASQFAPLQTQLTDDDAPFSNAWFGTLGYGLKHDVETLPQDARDAAQSFPSTLPDLHMTRYGLILHFDHTQRILTAYAKDDTCWQHLPKPAPVPALTDAPLVSDITSPMSKTDYADKVARILKHIHAGDIYQANLTRKFTGTFTANPPSPLALFQKLCTTSPAPYSACIKQGDTFILSSSPERFLKVEADGKAESRPIKGTAPRYAEQDKDRATRAKLENSPKDRAENLMIVDLMRNDLSRSCLPGSIKVDDLYQVSSYATLHHMAATITGQKRPDIPTLELVRRCFPPGSMTGAPKIRAMQICTELEGLARGIYSGALGWFGGDGSCDLSVVIRTLLMKDNRFEFQVGGAIVADSTPEKEWHETLVKARGIAQTLRIPEDNLQKI